MVAALALGGEEGQGHAVVAGQREMDMSVTREAVLGALARISLPDGKSLVDHDMIRALTIEGGSVRFVIEAPDPESARRMEITRPLLSAPRNCSVPTTKHSRWPSPVPAG